MLQNEKSAFRPGKLKRVFPFVKKSKRNSQGIFIHNILHVIYFTNLRQMQQTRMFAFVFDFFFAEDTR